MHALSDPPTPPLAPPSSSSVSASDHRPHGLRRHPRWPRTRSTRVQVNLDNVWVLLAAVLVIFMQAGFALVEAGLTRAKSVANIMMKNLMDFCAGAVAFLAVGFAIAFGGRFDGSGKFFGADGFFLGDGAFAYGNLTVPVFFMFQVAFAATAATIVSGAMAERTKFKALPDLQLRHQPDHLPGRRALAVGRRLAVPAATPPFHDFAGSTHRAHDRRRRRLLGRQGPRPPHRQVRPRRQAPRHPRPQHPLRHPRLLHPPGRLVRLQPRAPSWPPTAPSAASPSPRPLAGAMGALTAMATVWIKTGKPDVGMTGNGLLAGLVGITAGYRRGHPAGRADHRRPRRRHRRVRRRLLRPGRSRSTTRSAPSRSTASAAPSARSASGSSPARTSTASGSRACSTAAAPTSSSASSSACVAVAAWVSVTADHPLRRHQGHRRPAGLARRRSSPASTSTSTARPATAPTPPPA